MVSTVSSFKAAHKVFAFEPLHVDLQKTPIRASALLIPVEDLRIGQSFSPEYTPVEAYGRMDPIVTYKNTKRTLKIDFKCQAHHIFDGAQGVINNIRNINILTQLLYPAYYETGGKAANGDPLAVLGAPPFFRIRYGNYIGSFLSTGDFVGDEVTGLTGYITGFGHQIGAVAENVAFGKSRSDEGYRALPREIGVNFTFNVVHDKLVGWYNDRFSNEDGKGYGYNFPYNAGESGPSTYAYNRSAPSRTGGTMAAPTVSIGAATNDGVDTAQARENDPSGIHRAAASTSTTTAIGKSPHAIPTMVEGA